MEVAEGEGKGSTRRRQLLRRACWWVASTTNRNGEYGQPAHRKRQEIRTEENNSVGRGDRGSGRIDG